MQTTDTPVSLCPECNYKLECASAAESTPSPGDWALCFNCGAALQFDEELRQVRPTVEVPEEVRAQAEKLRSFKAGRRPHGIIVCAPEDRSFADDLVKAMAAEGVRLTVEDKVRKR